MTTDELIDDILGGPTAAAADLGITKQNVSVWRRRGVPLPWFMLLQCLHPTLDFTEVKMST